MAFVAVLTSPGKYKNNEYRVSLLEEAPYIDPTLDFADLEWAQANFDRIKWIGGLVGVENAARKLCEENDLRYPEDVTYYELEGKFYDKVV